jgi:hypothetical protein
MTRKLEASAFFGEVTDGALDHAVAVVEDDLARLQRRSAPAVPLFEVEKGLGVFCHAALLDQGYGLAARRQRLVNANSV